MKKGNGFTLIEMLGVLIILVMVFMITFSSLTKMIKDTNVKINNATLTVVEDATTDFLTEKNNIYPKDESYTYCVTLEQLIDNSNLTEKQISSIDDPDVFVKVTFQDNNPLYSITKTCTSVSVDIDFSLIGEKNMSFEVGDGGQYVEPGATAKNKAGESVTYTSTITNTKKEIMAYVDTTKVDIYTITYTAIIDGKSYSIERIVKVVDNTSPIITLTPSSVTLAITNSTYNVMEGVSVSDNSGEMLTAKVTSNLTLGQAGTYYVVYTATDSSGNKQTKKRTVIVTNSELVTILVANNNVTHEINSGPYVDIAATAQDISGNNLTSQLVTTIRKNGSVVSSISADKLATYYITYSIKKDNVTYSETKTVRIVDTTLPVITGPGTSTLSVTVPSYNLLTGYSVTDNSGEILNINVSGTLSLGIVGSYNITYTATDSSGNKATYNRVINIIDDVLPTVVFGTNGNSTYAKSRSTTVTTSDNCGINASSLKYLWSTSATAPSEASFVTSFTNGGTISTPAGVTGGYYLWIIEKDIYGNTAITRTNIFNLDNTKPIITMLGSSSVSVNGGSVYTDAGATATDNINGTITASIVTTNTVNTNVLGSYTVTYNVTDNAGNAATSVVRTVNVVDNNYPIITANSTSYTVTVGTSSAVPGTYFTTNKNGLANITSTTCVDTSNGNAVVSNLSTLAVGNHVISCTVTKSTGLSSSASTTISINNYAVGQAVTYAGINWHVMKISGLTATLLADSGTIAARRSFDTTYNASYPSCSYSSTGYCGNNVWSSSQIKTYLNSTWLSSTTLSVSNLIDDGNGYVRLITSAEYTTLKTAVGSPTWLYSSTISWWWTMTSSGTYKLYAVTDAGVLNPLMEAFDLSYVRPVITLK